MVTKGRKSKISKVKVNNQTRNKLIKKGKLKIKRNAKCVQTNVDQNDSRVENRDSEESDNGENMLEMVEQDDLAFIKHEVVDKSTSYSILNKIRIKDNNGTNAALKSRRKRKVVENDQDDVENDYEERNATTKDSSKRTKHLLPFKTKQGLVMRSIEVDYNELEANCKSNTVKPQEDYKEEAEAQSEQSDDGLLEIEEMKDLDLTRPVSTAQLWARRQAELEKQKFRIGVLCSGLLENPESKLKNFSDLFVLMDECRDNVENLITVRKFATVSLLEVFKDILPDYQIKHQDATVKLKKDTLSLQRFESSLLGCYKKYLQKLEKMASLINKQKGDTRKVTPYEEKLGEMAIKCMCDLLINHPYFNFAHNLVQMLIPFLNHRLVNVRNIVNNCCKSIFKEDKKGELSLIVVRRINHLVKTRSHDVCCEVLECLLALRIRDVNLDAEKEEELRQKKFMSRKQKLLSMSKVERKRKKRLDELEKEMLETKAEENKQSKQKFLTDIIKVVFTIYFRILKKAPNSKLLGTTLEGLAKFAHVINLEFYSDLVDVLDSIMKINKENGLSNLGYREQLHCIQTVFTILSGQGDVINIDPLRFYTHLYRNLLIVNSGRNHCDLKIVIKTLTHVLIKRRKKLSQQRLLSFLKRLSTLSLQVLHNGALGCLGIIKAVMQVTRSADLLLDFDCSRGSGRYDPYLMDPEFCNSNSTAFYELRLAARHYHPTVRKMATHIIAGVPASGEGSLNPEIGKLSPEQLFNEFDGSEMCLKPSIPVPKNVPGKKRPGRHIFKNVEFEKFCKSVSRKPNIGPFDFSEGMKC